MKHVKILSVGGSIIIPKTGFDIPFLKKFKKLILDEVKKGTSFILVIGGGATCRVYQDAAKQVVPMSADELDWLGIESTYLNAAFVKHLFKDQAHNEIVKDPRKPVKTKKPIIIAGGWKPGCSTDKDAVLLAKAYGAKEIINLSNIDYAYDKDPNKFKDAQKITSADWEMFRRDVVGYTWVPGKSAPFDPIASKEAQKLGLTVSIIKGTNLDTVKKAIQGKKFEGTVIHP